MTKDCNGCGEDRCYAVNSEGTKQCCNPHCTAGCDGPTATHCFVSVHSTPASHAPVHSYKCLHTKTKNNQYLMLTYLQSTYIYTHTHTRTHTLLPKGFTLTDQIIACAHMHMLKPHSCTGTRMCTLLHAT